jgi:hypothetical protein
MQSSSPGIFGTILNVANNVYASCSEITRINFKRLGLALVFTVFICGAVLAASFCEFWLNRNYYMLPLIFAGTALFYYILDTAIVMGDTGRGSIALKRIRVFIALVLGLFNSLLIDYYFFKADIDAARHAEIRTEQIIAGQQYSTQILGKEKQATALLRDMDVLESKLSGQLDSLNAEASGMGGSGKRGVANIWMAKYRSYQADSARFGELVIHKRVEVADLKNEILQLKQERLTEDQSIIATVSPGINKSLELLHKVVWQDGKFMNQFMSVLILLVSMLLELVPLIAKSFFSIDEYFELAQHKKEICTTNSSIRKQNAITMEATRLMNENKVSLSVEAGEHTLKILREKMTQSKTMLVATEDYMDAIIKTENRWKEKYPLLIGKYGRPIIDNAYETLSITG